MDSSLKPEQSYIDVDIAAQRLRLLKANKITLEYEIATARNGAGELNGSECTPRGWHYIRAKIGTGSMANAVFVGRRSTGEIFSEDLREQFPQRDWILTRILWLCGLEVGKNRRGNVDTMRRYIYIHGCPDSDVLGVPGSHGCIKMHNQDVMQLFEQVSAGTRVYIHE